MPNRLAIPFQSRLALALVLALAALCTPAHATYQSYLFNVDMTSLNPQPAYASIILSYDLPNTTAVGCSIWSELNHTGNYVNGCAGHSVSYEYTEAGMMDGIFSIRFSFDDAVSLLTPFTLIGVNSNGRHTAPLVLMDVNRVPEPTSLLLIGLGLLGVGISRRNRHD